ncbi:thiol-disulfide oxidoreductase DCC family protein [Cesiribacter andamanensis]|uniref:thiol-disulfide oxidoreductase DCC family protein n=1 Tax=Cesiribacter andamanensis TaxID=649507 RepID=UPI00034CDDA8|nr:DCC1-like thiol-disulfide oxidoreductase family protein [Cesiribacter andamanensis]
MLQAGTRAIVLFDGVCNLCKGAVDFIIRHDAHERFAFASLQSEAGQALLRFYELPTADFDSMVLLKEGRLYQKSEAALQIAGELGGLWKLFTPFLLLPRPLRDGLYSVIARNRYRFLVSGRAAGYPPLGSAGVFWVDIIWK